MLAAPTASQVHKAVTVVPTDAAEAVLDLDDVLFFEQSRRCILELAHLKDGLLSSGAAHGDSFLGTCGAHRLTS